MGAVDTVDTYLRVAKVHNLVQKLVDQDKVVLDVLLGDLAEVVLHDLDHLEEELKDHGGVFFYVTPDI